MSDSKIAFIICVNDEEYFRECVVYIENLVVPEGYDVEIIPIRNAQSMTAGYNRGMELSNAKYKIYLHQDVFCIEKEMLFWMLDIFRDKRIGMIGCMGIKDTVPADADFLHWFNVARVFLHNGYESKEVTAFFDDDERDIVDVNIIDGMFMATQYDICWEERIEGWHLYDASQSINFLNAGYRIVLPTKKSWILHDTGIIKAWDYDFNREIFCEIYPMFSYICQLNEKRIKEHEHINEIKAYLIKLIEEKNIHELEKKCLEILIDLETDSWGIDNDILYICFYAIVKKEEVETYGESKLIYTDFRKEYDFLKFWIWRKEFLNQLDPDYSTFLIENGIFLEKISEKMYDFAKWNVIFEDRRIV